ncbi:hypothetical protein [Leifsonia sp. Leaf264]|uniref:hypothetical protein n=1 Tax=Leifsonia sp. Leaf264 TaxID=1736314 RepID=UPI0006FC5132|nr:hypothetical protein [Leifsonia sp. Leaf264]KQP00903.1 hypothetical protein ASF30_22065 [Leifsonia sp. Leaf264]
MAEFEVCELLCVGVGETALDVVREHLRQQGHPALIRYDVESRTVEARILAAVGGGPLIVVPVGDRGFALEECTTRAGFEALSDRLRARVIVDRNRGGYSLGTQYEFPYGAFTPPRVLWFSPTAQAGEAALVARSVGFPIIAAPIGDGEALVAPHDPGVLLMAWHAMRSRAVLIWTNGVHGGFGVWDSAGRIVHRWGEHWWWVDPSDGSVTDAAGRIVRDALLEIADPPPDFARIVAAFGLDGAGAQRLRPLIDPPEFSNDTVERFVAAVGLPSGLSALVGGGALAHRLPGARDVLPASWWAALLARLSPAR